MRDSFHLACQAQGPGRRSEREAAQSFFPSPWDVSLCVQAGTDAGQCTTEINGESRRCVLGVRSDVCVEIRKALAEKMAVAGPGRRAWKTSLEDEEQTGVEGTEIRLCTLLLCTATDHAIPPPHSTRLMLILLPAPAKV